MKGRVCVVTGTRAEFGLLRPLINSLLDSDQFVLQLVVTGTHLSETHGNTYQEIADLGFNIDAKVDCEIGLDTAEAISSSVGKGLIGFGKVFGELNPDLLIILGDRTEILATAIAALIKGIPIAHLHGGELTEGAYDESIRHSITKMSHLHFTSTENYRKRVIQLGEQPNSVFNVGAIGIDSIMKSELLAREKLEAEIGKLCKNNFLITYHPVTLEDNTARYQFNELLKSLEPFEETRFIFTYPNADKNGNIIIDMIEEFVSINDKSIAFKSLGQLRYLSLLQYVDLVIGNSSSGIIEVPYFKIPTINIGDRQKGREAPKSVINCKPERQEISKAIMKGLSKDFIKMVQNQEKIYGEGDATEKIMKVLTEVESIQVTKKFYDI